MLNGQTSLIIKILEERQNLNVRGEIGPCYVYLSEELFKQLDEGYVGLSPGTGVISLRQRILMIEQVKDVKLGKSLGGEELKLVSV